MAFALQRDESVSKAIKRVGRERIESALESLKDWRRAESIHDARKDIKKVRATVRLVRPRIAKKDYGRLMKLLREAARPLAAPRDASVKMKTLMNLTRRTKGGLAAGALAPVHAALRYAADEETRRFAEDKAAKAVIRTLRRAAKKLKRVEVRGHGWKLLGPGVEAVFLQARRARLVALHHPSPDNFHEWRKRAKDLWYQVTLLRPLRPGLMEAMANQLETLGESLGDDHDLVVLRHTAEERLARNANPRELETLTALIEARQRELRTAALALGARFDAENSAAFGNRLAGYWQAWRSKKK